MTTPSPKTFVAPPTDASITVGDGQSPAGWLSYRNLAHFRYSSFMRRIIGLVFALSLIVAGSYFAIALIYAEGFSVKVLAMIFIIIVGGIWLYRDFVRRT